MIRGGDGVRHRVSELEMNLSKLYFKFLYSKAAMEVQKKQVDPVDDENNHK